MRSLRERNRHNAMRTTQRAALDLFEAQGFEQVTVAEIAEAVGMAASTIYRHFETKEAIVLWDEHDASLDAAFVGAFTRHPPLKAIRTVFVDELWVREDLVDAELGLPRDLNGDNVVDDQNHAGDYIILPVCIVVRWQGMFGERSLRMVTMLTDFELLSQ